MIAILKAKNSKAKGKLPDDYIVEFYKIDKSRPLKDDFEQVDEKAHEKLMKNQEKLLKSFYKKRGENLQKEREAEKLKRQEFTKKWQEQREKIKAEIELLFTPEQLKALKEWVNLGMP